MENAIVDLSVISEGIISQRIKKESLVIENLIIPLPVLSYLENLANEGKTKGLIGLEEIENLKSLMGDRLFFKGNLPRHEITDQQTYPLVREISLYENASLLTSNKIQYQISASQGIETLFIEVKRPSKLKLEKFFDEKTMSVHLKEDSKPLIKKGTPGEWDFQEYSKTKLTQSKIREISREIIEEAETRNDSFIEIEREGSTIVQMGSYRIVITNPPLSDGWEITAVRPIASLNLEDYGLSEKLYERICHKAEGILVAGSPGMGKSTFASSLTQKYGAEGKIVKTIEAPRDLVLPNFITQYSISHSTPEEIRDILLLSRPDYALFDEMRNTQDFELYSDLRLTGIGLVGVVHGTTAVDSIQRFLGRLELGVIPQVIDTVIFIDKGNVANVLSLKMEVKVPSGMTEADLARPVVVISDFETGKTTHEIYSFGEETMIVPVTTPSKTGVNKLAQRSIEKELKKYTKSAYVEVDSPQKATVYVPEASIPQVIGKQGKQIEEIEENLGIKLDVKQITEEKAKKGVKEKDSLKYQIKDEKNFLKLEFNPSLKNKELMICIEGEELMRAKTSKKSVLKINKKQPQYKTLIEALTQDKEVDVVKTD